MTDQRILDMMTKEELVDFIINIEKKFAEYITDIFMEEDRTIKDYERFTDFLDNRFREVFDYLHCVCVDKEVKDGICSNCNREVQKGE